VKTGLMKTIDRFFGSLLAKILPSPICGKEFTPHSFLIIRPGGIGDAVLLIPSPSGSGLTFCFLLIFMSAWHANPASIIPTQFTTSSSATKQGSRYFPRTASTSRWAFSQNSGLLPNRRESRRTIAGLRERRSRRSSLTVWRDTSSVSAKVMTFRP